MSDEALNAHLERMDECADDVKMVEVEQGYLDWLERIVDNRTDEIVRIIQDHEQAHLEKWHTGTIIERRYK